MAQPGRAPAPAPAIELGDFQLTVHRRQFPDAQDRWDGNWLEVTAQCAQAGAIVAAGGPIIEAADLQRFRDELMALRHLPSAIAELHGGEPHIRVQVTATAGMGDVRVRVELTPEPESQGHWFEFTLDPSYLAAAIQQLDAALERFPVRGQPPALDTLDLP